MRGQPNTALTVHGLFTICHVGICHGGGRPFQKSYRDRFFMALVT